jgi:hypothetical protein
MLPNLELKLILKLYIARTGKKRISYRFGLVKSEGKSDLDNLGVDGSIMVVYILMSTGSVLV